MYAYDQDDDLARAINNTLATAQEIKRSPARRETAIKRLKQYFTTLPDSVVRDLHALATHRHNPTPATRAAIWSELQGTIPLTAEGAELVLSTIVLDDPTHYVPRGNYGREFREMDREVRKAYETYKTAKAHLDVGDNHRVYYNSGLNALKQIFRIENRVHHRAEQDATGEYYRELKKSPLWGVLQMLNVREMVTDFEMRYKKSDELTSRITDITNIYKEIDDTPRRGRSNARRSAPIPATDRITTKFATITGIRFR
ncbi:MAG: hypothetical protein PHR28_12770 [candidate division Zixibacteria bacterium]|nr:hypothetical protein [candidate division Zixibacteria bacterium]